MTKGRLEAFSDGMIAIFITVMVLELKVPHGVELAALEPLLPALLTYVLSFVYLAIYWNNHHHMFHATKHVTGGILWANLHLLFWGRAAHGRHRLLHPPARDHRAPGSWLLARDGHRVRLERQAIARPLLRGHPALICNSLDRDRHLRARCSRLAHS
jgi:transmembrane protein TMEM174 (potassium channel)